jgi:hypothetical protein
VAESEDTLAVPLAVRERWTDGNLAMRRLLENQSADPRSHDERRRILMETVIQLMAWTPHAASGRAPIHAGWAVLASTAGDISPTVDHLIEVALQADAEAHADQPCA